MPHVLEGKHAVAHLLRRAAFGVDARTWADWRDLPYDEALDRLLAGLDTPVPADPPGFDPYDVKGSSIERTWLERMRRGEAPLAEKLALFWHGHFATSNVKVQDAPLLWAQYRLFREKGAGPFRDLLLGVSRDVAMIRWLDGNQNRKGHPNENYARELQELFTLGIGNYTERDIREVARAFTGWSSRSHDFVFLSEFHDDGEKTIHGRTGRWSGEEAIDILLEQPACPRFLATKLLRFFSHLEPTEAEVTALAATMRDGDMDVKAALEVMFRDPAFRDVSRHRALVRSPVEFVVGAVNAVGLDEIPDDVRGAAGRMGQILFRPPSVKGWPGGTGWLSSGAVVERLKVAKRIAEIAPEDGVRGIVETAFQGDVPAGLASALSRVEGGDRVALVLGSPEFQMA